MKSKAHALSLAVLSAGAGLTGMASNAQARTLFDMLFERREVIIEEEPVRPRRALPRELDPYATGGVEKPRKPARSAAKPAAPAVRDYAYKAAPLVTLQAAKIFSGDEATAAPQPMFGGSPLVRAIREAGEVEVRVEKTIHDALIAHYKAAPEFIWITDGSPNARAEAVRDVLAAAGDVGLAAQDYTAPMSAVSMTGGQDSASLVRYELMLSTVALRYAHDAMNGRITPNKLSIYHDFQPKPFDAAAFLKRLSTSANPANDLLAQNPDSPQFGALAEQLRALRGQTQTNDTPEIAPGSMFKPGVANPEFPKVLQIIAKVLGDNLSEEDRVILYEYRDSPVYEPAVVPLVKAAQKAKGVKPDGVIGPATLAALVGQTHGNRVQKLELALERLRWLPRDFGPKHVFINQPAFWASYVNGGQEALGMRVVVGTRENQTSFFHDQIEYVEFNPYWGVPRSILMKEMLPKLQQDPSYLDRLGYEVFTTSGTQVSSTAVDWWSGGAEKVVVRQPPSEKNALGELKIMFPNKHDIYMHDTPQRNLFEKDVRAFSHGCIRLHQPREMAAAVLGSDMDTIEARLALGHNSLKLEKPVPVFVSYFTAWPDQSGTVQYYTDVYGRDAQLVKAIQTTETVRRAPTSTEG